MKVVWIVDSEHWPRALLRAELIERGYDAVGYETAEAASHNVRTRFPDVIVVELRGLDRQDVEPFFEIGVPVIGIANTTQPQWVDEFRWAELTKRPVSIGEVAEAVAKYV